MSYSGDPSSSDTDAVRFEIQDTNTAAPLLQDPEIAWAILQETGTTADDSGVSLLPAGIFASSARCCEALSRNFAMQADTEIGSLRTIYSKQAQTYAQRAQELRLKASSFYAPYAGGQSIGEKVGWAEDPDKVPPIFRRDQFRSPWAADRGGGDPDYGPPYPE